MDFHLLFQEPEFRQFCTRNTHDPQVLRILEEAEEAGGDVELANIAPYITSKLSRFVLDDNLKRTIGQEEIALDFRKIMDQGQVLLINLGKGRFGSAISGLIAGQIVSRFKAAARGLCCINLLRSYTPPFPSMEKGTIEIDLFACYQIFFYCQCRATIHRAHHGVMATKKLRIC